MALRGATVLGVLHAKRGQSFEKGCHKNSENTRQLLCIRRLLFERANRNHKHVEQNATTSQSNLIDDDVWFGKLELREMDWKLIASGIEMIPLMTGETTGDESAVSSAFKARFIWMSCGWICKATEEILLLFPSRP
jgi:hypothetical protein